MRSYGLFLLGLLAWIGPADAAGTVNAPTAPEDVTVIGARKAPPITPDTNYWVEDAYGSTFPLLGPTFAQGLIIWNHSEPYDKIGPSLPPIRAMEGMAALGWDIVRLQRNSKATGNLHDTWTAELADVSESLATQISNAHVQGYKRVILAGQEVGGGLALEASKSIDDLFAVIAFAPNSGVEWCGRPVGGKMACQPDQPRDGNAQVILNHTWDQMSHAHPARLFVLFPDADEQVPHLRGPTARDILTKRGDLPFLLVDETSGVTTNAGADKPAFDAYASCMDLFLAAELTPRPGEFHCGSDETPAALAQMGIKPHGEGWFGYTTRGQAIYLEASTSGPVTYGWGAGANGKTRQGFKTLDAKHTGSTFVAELAPEQFLRGVRYDALLRVTIDQQDGTRTAAVLHRLAGNS